MVPLSTKGVPMSDVNPDAPPPPPPPGVSRRDADIANSGAAVWTNKVFLVLGSVVKIVFLEQGGADEPPFFRTAVVMSHQDAIALRNVLTSMLADVERQVQAQSGGSTPPHG